MLNTMFLADTITPTASPSQLIFAALVGLLVLLVLIIWVKLHAMLSILISACLIGVLAGMDVDMIIDSVGEGIGSTLKSIALLVGLGSMFGAILEISGGAQRIASTLVKVFGEKKAAWALGITGMVIAMPVFFDAGLIILIPLALTLAKSTKRSSLFYAIPLLAGLAVGHAFIPPTPGPILVASLLGVDLSYVIIVGILCGIVAMILAGPVFGGFIGNRLKVPVPNNIAEMPEIDESKLPSFGMVVGIIFIPLVLIIAKTIANLFIADSSFMPVLTFFGEPFVALTIATIVAMIVLGTRYGYNREELEKIMTKSLEPTGMILLVTACGGVLKYMLQSSGLGDVIGDLVSGLGLPMVVVAFIIAVLVRISVGSATVAMTMAAGIVASIPGVSDLSSMYLACCTAAVAGGATVCSHFNDSGFWLVKSLLQIDEKTTLKSWTVMETIVGGSGFVVALIVSFFV